MRSRRVAATGPHDPFLDIQRAAPDAEQAMLSRRFAEEVERYVGEPATV